MPLGDGPQGLPDEHRAVRGADGVERAHRHLVLPRRVLGVDLVDLHALGGQHGQGLGAEVGLLHQPGHPVGGADAGRLERRVGDVAAAERELDLDGRLEREALGLGRGDEATQDRPRAAGVQGAVLGHPVDGGPRPAGLAGERDHVVEVGYEPQVAVGAALQLGRHDRVVREEQVEDR